MKKLTKKQQQMVESYHNALDYYGMREVEDCYKKPSVAKTRAEYFIKNEIEAINNVSNLGVGSYTVVGHNCNMFSCAYTVYAFQPKADRYRVRAIVYHTAYNRYIIPFDDTIEQELEEVI